MHNKHCDSVPVLTKWTFWGSETLLLQCPCNLYLFSDIIDKFDGEGVVFLGPNNSEQFAMIGDSTQNNIAFAVAAPTLFAGLVSLAPGKLHLFPQEFLCGRTEYILTLTATRHSFLSQCNVWDNFKFVATAGSADHLKCRWTDPSFHRGKKDVNHTFC